MRAWTLARRSLSYYWRANLAVVLGFATATAVLAGALAVGDSVRESLARAALERLGKATHAIESTGLFREELAADVAARRRASAAPLLSLRAVAVAASSGKRVSDVLVHGVDERFWSFHRLPAPELNGREALLGEALGSELGTEAGDSVMLRLESASEVPGSSLFGRREDPAQGLRVTTRGTLSRAQLGEFALRPPRDAVRAAFVPLALLQRTLGVRGRVNTGLLAVPADAPQIGPALGEALRLEDLGLRLRVLGAGTLQLDSTSSLLDEATARAARDVAAAQGLRVGEALIYLANTIRAGGRELPYAVVAALDEEALQARAGRDLSSADEPILLLNDWAAADLGATPGAGVDLEYYVWREEGRLATLGASFRLAGIVPLSNRAADRDLVPDYPGITDAPRISDWDPPFPIDLERIRPRDEAYWDRHRTTPKAYVSLRKGQELWGHRLGRLTAMRFTPEPGVAIQAAAERFAEALRGALAQEVATAAAGPTIVRLNSVRAAALRAARGSTDFGAYFVYFSFFLVAAALLLAGLFFRLGIEQRQREVGLLGALGFAAARLRGQFLGEGAALAGLGGLLGAGGALLYAALVLWGLRSLWSDLLPTGDLALHVTPRSLGLGALGAVASGVLAVVWTLRDVQQLSSRALLAGARQTWAGPPAPRRLAWPAALGLAAAIVIWATRADRIPQAAGFFGGGTLLLASAVLASRVLIGGRPRGAPIRSVAGLGRRAASFRPGRSVLCVALLASATFVILAVGAFRRKEPDMSRQGEAGGYALLAWSLQPLHHDLSSADERAALGLSPDELHGVSIVGFRASRGEDVSCLNLHRPQQPTVLAPGAAFLREGRFSFQASLAETEAERRNPWLLLEDEPRGGAIPAIADSSSLAYVLHKKLGDEMPLGETGVRVRFVGALSPGLLQSEILVAEPHFVKAFPSESGYRFFLVEAPAALAAGVASHLESQLGDYGFDVTHTTARLAAFHRVENMYISTFQALGALGLLLGTVGLATVLVRNALEQRRELALLRAVGYEKAELLTMLLAENALLLVLGFAAGALPALVAIEPVLEAQRGDWPLALVGSLAAAVGITGALVSYFAVTVIQRMPLLSSLRAE